jgi:hypothetical protein
MNNADRPINAVPHMAGTYGGLTKREYFAGLAMQSVLNSRPLTRNEFSRLNKKTFGEDLVAEMSVLMADALLAELEKEQQP